MEVTEGIHHVWDRGNNRQAIFRDDADRIYFLRLLGVVAAKREWRCLGYSLLSNHFHLVIETMRLPTLGLGMRDFLSRYVQDFNERHTTGGGHLFQERFGSKPVKTDEQFAQLLRYVARNPVAAGLCSSPEEWQWSSHSTQLTNRADPLVATERVSELLSVWGGRTESRYAQLFEPDGPLKDLDPDTSPWAIRPKLSEILDVADFPAACRRARRHGYRLTDIAAHTGLSEATISRRARGASEPL